jgi:hypothetical protein
MNKMSKRKSEIFKMTKAQFYKITDTIYFDAASIFLVKVFEHETNTDPEFCYCHNREEARRIIEDLANKLSKELSEDSTVANGKVKITVEVGDRNIIIRKQALGRLYNGPATPVYTLTYNEVSHGFISQPPQYDAIDQLIEELKTILDKTDA